MPEPALPAAAEEIARAHGLALRWVPGGGPVDLAGVARGPVHVTYRVRRDGREYALRVSADTADDAHWECRVLAAAAAAALAPCVAACAPAAGILVTHWVEGRAWSPAEASAPGNTLRIGALLRAIQAVRPPTPWRSGSAGGWVRLYEGMIAGDGPAHRAAALREQAARHERALAALPPAAPVLCHSDLHPLNLLDDGASLLVLDWEYAHVGDPYWDLAGWLSANDLGGDYAASLLAAHAGREPGTAELERLRLLVWLYDYVCLLWSDLHLQRLRGPAAEQLAARAVRLRARLS